MKEPLFACFGRNHRCSSRKTARALGGSAGLQPCEKSQQNTGGFCPGLSRRKAVIMVQRSLKKSVPNLFFAFSAQKTHVKPQNHLSHSQSTTSAWHFSYTQPAILKIGVKR